MLLEENNQLQGGNSKSVSHRAAPHHPTVDYYLHNHTNMQNTRNPISLGSYAALQTWKAILILPTRLFSVCAEEEQDIW